MADLSRLVEELVTIAGKRLKLDLQPHEVALLQRTLVNQMGEEVGIGPEKVWAVEIPADSSVLRDFEGINDYRYLLCSVQVKFQSMFTNVDDAVRRSGLQTTIALIFHAIRG